MVGTSQHFDCQAIKSKIRSVPDFPKKGILFYDITTLLKEADLFVEVIAQLAAPFKKEALHKVAAIESRGFIFGAPLAQQLAAGFVPIRKPGKLPHQTIEENHALEYGVSALALHQDAIAPGERVLIVDDLLATGGTAAAAVNLVKRLDGVIVGIAFMIELLKLKGREKLPADIPIVSLLSYD